MGIEIIESITVLGIVKVLLVVLLGVYLVFAGLMAKQIQAMTRAVQMKDDFLIRALGLIHFGVASAVFLVALLIL